MATLLVIRTALNGDIAVDTDGETGPWTVAVRNQAISDAYADLWVAGVRKDAKQDFATDSNAYAYALTTIRSLGRLELLDSLSHRVDTPKGLLEPDGAGTGAWQLALRNPIATGYTLRVRGYAPFKSVFSGDSDTDDLPAEFARLPRLKARAILYGQQISRFARYGERQAVPPEMNMSVEQVITAKREAEAEYLAAARLVGGLRPRASQIARLD